ncbi:hypothetical protein BaRGS_00028613 [Batillaria attramentaria]|uniref:Uncharacterized protein n=1 Tax=Batillaria attramentaria TaxID=370345 RepID=A0ABD0JZC3_9CAEN
MRTVNIVCRMSVSGTGARGGTAEVWIRLANEEAECLLIAGMGVSLLAFRLPGHADMTVLFIFGNFQTGNQGRFVACCGYRRQWQFLYWREQMC